MTQLLKFCVNCENCLDFTLEVRDVSRPAKCWHPDSKFINLVTGGEEFRTCEAMRFMRCGPEAKLFVPKEKA